MVDSDAEKLRKFLNSRSKRMTKKSYLNRKELIIWNIKREGQWNEQKHV